MLYTQLSVNWSVSFLFHINQTNSSIDTATIFVGIGSHFIVQTSNVVKVIESLSST